MPRHSFDYGLGSGPDTLSIIVLGSGPDNVMIMVLGADTVRY